jgi:hypothetical protein
MSCNLKHENNCSPPFGKVVGHVWHSCQVYAMVSQQSSPGKGRKAMVKGL